jgi:hypothetical protein
MRNWLRSLAAAAAFCLVLPAANAQVPGDAEIDRLMELLQERARTERVLRLVNERDAAGLPPELRACMLAAVDVDLVMGEKRGHYAQIFADPALRGQVLEFLGSPVGQRFIELAAASMAGEGEPRPAPLAAAEEAEIERFLGTPAGELFSQLPQRLEELQDASLRRNMAGGIAECAALHRVPARGLTPRAAALEVVRKLRLYAMFHAGSEQAFSGSAAQALPEALRACYREFASEERIVPLLADLVEPHVTEPAAADGILAFLDTELGAKLVGYLSLIGDARLREAPAPAIADHFSEVELVQIGVFSVTPGGQVLENINRALPQSLPTLTASLVSQSQAHCAGVER